MEERNFFERLVDISPGMEIWWDSSPVVFDNWCRKLLDKADPADRNLLKTQFSRMYDKDDPQNQLFRGVTTNRHFRCRRFKPILLIGQGSPRISYPKIRDWTVKAFFGSSTKRS